MLTLAFAQIVWSIAFQWVEVTGGDNGILGVWPEKWAASASHFYWLSLGVAALAVAVLRIIVFSPFGYALRATRDSIRRSEAIGINGKQIQWTAFVIAGTAAGIAGALFAYLKGSVFPDSLGISLSVDALVMVLLGRGRDGVRRDRRRHRLQGAQHLAGEPDRSVQAGAWRRHRADRGRVAERHRRGAGNHPASPTAAIANRNSCVPDRDRRMSIAPTLLSVEGLSKSYGGVHAVRGVSFELKAGEILALIGPNGAGKSTCFDMLNGQTTPGAGKINLLGQDTTGKKPRAIWRLGVGRTFQITATFPTMTVRENIQVALVSYHGQTVQSLGLDAKIRAGRGRLPCWRWSAWTATPIVPAAKSTMAISSGWSLPWRSPTSRSCC